MAKTVGSHPPSSGDRYRFQFIAAASASISIFVAGIAGGWNGRQLSLMADNSPIPFSMDHNSWLIVCTLFGVIVTLLPTIWIGRTYGPQRTLLFSAVPLLFGWMLIAAASDFKALFVGRFFFGCAYGTLFVTLPVYLSEIAAVRVRGTLLVMAATMRRAGILFCFAVAPFVSTRTMALMACVPCIGFAWAFWQMPDSPYHLVTRGRHDRAVRSLVWLRGHTNVGDEMASIELAVLASTTEHTANWRELFRMDQRRALSIGIATAMVMPLCGSSTVLDYLLVMIERIGWDVPTVVVGIVLASVHLVAVVVGNFTIDVLGRRPLLLASCATMALCTATVGGYFAAEHRMELDVRHLGWLPVVTLMVFQFAFGVGLEPVFVTLQGELFPKHLKAMGTTVCLSMYLFADVVVGKSFHVVSDVCGKDVAFAVLTVFTAAYFVYAVVAVPETKRRKHCDIMAELLN